MGVRKNFSRGGKSTFCLSFSVCWRCNPNGRTQKIVQFHGNSHVQCFPYKKILHWENICFSENGYFKSELAEFQMNYKLREILEYAQNLIKIRTNYIFNSNSSPLFSCFSNVLEGCECSRMRFHCAHGLLVLRNCAL